MKRMIVVLALLLAGQQAGRASLTISCQGTVCGGSPAGLQFQYELFNAPGNPPEAITSFTISTEDLNGANYLAWWAPPGWIQIGTVAAGGGVAVNSGLQTPHLAFSLNPPAGISAGTITWTIPGGDIILPGQTRAFGFNNPNSFEDGYWSAPGAPTGGTVNWASVVAGPAGFFSDGPVHTPVPEPASSAAVVAAALLLIPIWRRWKAIA